MMNWRISKHQNGLALLVFVIALALGSIALFFSSTPSQIIRQDRDAATRLALKKARQALIDYAVNYPEITGNRGPGYLPCPDRDNNGVGDTGVVPSCNSALGTAGSVGRLPYRSLNIGELTDGSGERLWYAVSKTFSNFGVNKKLNTARYGTITVRDRDGVVVYDGTAPDAAVAVVIAPGEPLVRADNVVQDRSAVTGDINDPLNYLDIALGEDNADFVQRDNNGFIQGPVLDANGDAISNDIVEVITYRDIMMAVVDRVSGELGAVLESYRNQCGDYPESLDFDSTRAPGDYKSDGEKAGHIPVDEADPNDWTDACAMVTPLPAWIEAEDWHKEILYVYSETQPCVPADCLTVNNMPAPNNDIELLLVFGGRDLNGSHDSDDIEEYFENENSDGDRVFDIDEPEDYVRVLAQ